MVIIPSNSEHHERLGSLFAGAAWKHFVLARRPRLDTSAFADRLVDELGREFSADDRWMHFEDRFYRRGVARWSFFDGLREAVIEELLARGRVRSLAVDDELCDEAPAWLDRLPAIGLEPRAFYELEWIAGNVLDLSGRVELPPRLLHAVGLSLRLVDRVELALAVRNLGNLRQTTITPAYGPPTPYPAPISDFIGYPLPGRSLWATLRVDLELPRKRALSRSPGSRRRSDSP